MAHKISSPDQWLPLYGDILYRYGLARVSNPDLAEDLVQETLLAAFKAKNNFAGQASEKTWMIGILKHKIIDSFRKSSRENTQEFDEQVTSEDHYFNPKGSWQTELSAWSKPDKSMEQEQFLSTLQKCINGLPQRMSQLFILRELEGMTNEEICEVMSISSSNNLWVILSRARVQLRHCLDVNWLNQ